MENVIKSVGNTLITRHNHQKQKLGNLMIIANRLVYR